uniref:Synaptobrevin homolog YKT6 n=1 Tax=Talaromyces marneffei PM1 TaxID=1077442 RepID=A0A093VD42_TALMA
MKIYYMGILRNETKPALELCGEKDLSSRCSFSRFTRENYNEFMMLFTKTVAAFHSMSRDGIAGVIVSDSEYPPLVAQQLLSKMYALSPSARSIIAANSSHSTDEFISKHPHSEYANTNLPERSLSFPQLADYIKKYQDPSQADSIMKIQQELDQTKIVLHKTIESVLERGEKIDSLVAKSDGLSAQSKMFYTQAKKQNSCCIVM